jgi:hypothetical protein
MIDENKILFLFNRRRTILRKSIKLITRNSKINKLVIAWGALAQRVALQIINISLKSEFFQQ